MPKRRTVQAAERKKRFAGSPGKVSKYQKKRRVEKKATRPQPTHTKISRTEAGTRLTATVCNINLERGFIILRNEMFDKIYLSDGVLGQYTPSLQIALGETVDCTVFFEERGPRVKQIHDIS